ncbi:MAG: permease, partial [Candidatus Riflebacteria bacterium]|nr:permease [Candidatus Riflebacteria bacterium]
KANPLISYPVAALSGGILTVCSCGVIPIFTSILQQGAGVGPAFTFLMSAPAVNLIALFYTGSLLGKSFLYGRTIAVFSIAILIGALMRFCFPDQIYEPKKSKYVMVEEEKNYTDTQLALFFILLILVMLTTTGLLDNYTLLVTKYIGVNTGFGSRIITVIFEIILIALWSWKIFDKYEIKLWVKKSYQLFIMIFPKVLAGIFVCGIISKNFPLTEYL